MDGSKLPSKKVLHWNGPGKPWKSVPGKPWKGSSCGKPGGSKILFLFDFHLLGGI